MTTRRTFLLRSGMASAAALLARAGLTEQQTSADPAVQPNPTLPDQLRAAAADETIKTTKLTDTIFLLQGVGGNIVCQIGPDGKVIIDSGVATGTRKLLDALGKLDENRLKLLINTHWHMDHTDGNAVLHLQGGAFIIAQENTRARLASPQYLRVYDVHFPAAPEAALPQETFADANTLWVNNDQLTLVHAPNAHTDSDIFIHFVKGNVIHAGDLWFNGMYPMIDLSSGGSIIGMISGVNAVLAKADDRTKIVPGHGALGNKAALAAYRTMLVTVANRVRDLKARGKTVNEAIAAKPTSDLDPAWAKMGPLKPDTFVALVYESL
ncbi:MAG TPA: MBL fold metallo-hydrolase [Acidobacteriaceae bacterium]|nr:MBL fold metallo-hydrolase [Acidobacteriaceae bacterium]